MTTMRGEIRELLARARRSRRDGYEAPVVATLEEAQRLAAGIAAEMARAKPEERLLRLAALSEIEQALEASTAFAQAEMTRTAQQLIEARKGSAACRSYAAAGGPGRRLG